MSQIKVTYIQHMGSDITVVNAARISFNNEVTELSPKDEKLISYLADNEHMSPFEHETLTVIIECPLYIRSQIHRHRTFAYNEVSRRYTSENIEFFMPTIIRKQAASNRQASDGQLDKDNAKEAKLLMNIANDKSLEDYNRLIELGVPREQARGVLNQNLMTKFYMTGSLRNWAHFVKLRLDKHAQEEVQVVGKQVYDILIDKFPISTRALLEI